MAMLTSLDWDIPSATINRADVLHTGTWEYHENLWGKSHEFKSNTDKALPAGITAITPATVNDQYHDGDTINADSFQIPAENVVPSTNPLYDANKVQYLDEHGVWTADDAWDKSNVVVDTQTLTLSVVGHTRLTLTLRIISLSLLTVLHFQLS